MHVVFGGSGGLGSAVVRELARRSEPVRSVSRSRQSSVPPSVELMTADAADPAAAKRACEGAKVVYCCVSVPYTDDSAKSWPPLLSNILEGASAAGARFALGDNLYMYLPTEDDKISERLPEQPTTKKGRVRADMANTLRQAHREGKAHVVMARCSDFYGPGVTNALLADRVFGAALRGEKAGLLGDIDTRHSYCYIDDAARALILLAERDEAAGEAWHVPHAPAITTREFVEKVYRAAGREPKVQVASRLLVSAAGWFNPMMREMKEMLYQWESPFVVDDSKFRGAFGAAVQATPIDEGVAATLEWFKSRTAGT